MKDTDKIIFRDDFTDPSELSCIDPDTDEERPCRDWDEAGEDIRNWLECEKSNLDIDLPDGAVVVGFGVLGLWRGPVNGGKVMGGNVNSIFWYAEDSNRIFCDRHNVRGEYSHHDGTNRVLWRVAPSKSAAEALVHKVAYCGLSEADFRRRTRSLRPYVAKAFGW